MDSNEEYLDQLLKSLTEGNSSAKEEADDSDDGIGDLLNQFSDEPHSVPEDLISGMLGGAESTPESPEDEMVDILSDEVLASLSAAEPEDLDNAIPEISEISELPEEPELTELPEEPEAAEEADFNLFEISGLDPVFPADESGDEEQDDLGSLLESLGAEGDEDVKEISDLLEKAERDEPIVDLTDSEPVEAGGEAEEAVPKKGKRQKKERVKKEKKVRVKKEKKSRRGRKSQEAQAVADGLPQEPAGDIDSILDSMQQETGTALPGESAEREKKPGFWGKLLNTLTQEEEDAEDPADLISDENGAIMEQLDKEEQDKTKGKKKKKADKKKGKDKKAADAEDDEELEEASDKKKKKKEKKPKKEKPPVSVEELLPDKKLSLRKILPMVLVALVFCAAYVLISNLYISHVNKQRAEEAYYAGDYLECYGLLYGQDLNESQAVIYHKSELALQMERMKGNYLRLVQEDKELEALDYLVQSVCRKEEFYLKGQEWGCQDMVEQTFTGMAALLEANYGLREEYAIEIAALKSDVDYTIALMNVLEDAHSPAAADGEAGGQEQPVSYEDLLPEEEEISDTEFVDTIE